jgi:hypothetical protein
MTAPEGKSGPPKKLDPVPFWIMGVIVLVVIGIIIYGP